MKLTPEQLDAIEHGETDGVAQGVICELVRGYREAERLCSVCSRRLRTDTQCGPCLRADPS